MATGLEKVSLHSNPKERQCQWMFKLLHNCTHLTCCKVMLKFSKPGFSNTWTVNFQMFKLVLEKAEEPEIKLPTSAGSLKSKRVPEKQLFLLFWGFPGGSEVTASAWNVGDLGSIPGWGRFPGEGNGNPLQYSCLKNPVEGVHGVSKSQKQLSDFTFFLLYWLFIPRNLQTNLQPNRCPLGTRDFKNWMQV